jgi:hypothetical protein
MTTMETEVGERAWQAVALLDADLAASRRLVSDLRRAVERWQTKADAAIARAEAAEAEVERLRAALETVRAGLAKPEQIGDEEPRLDSWLIDSWLTEDAKDDNGKGW